MEVNRWPLAQRDVYDLSLIHEFELIDVRLYNFLCN